MSPKYMRLRASHIHRSEQCVREQAKQTLKYFTNRETKINFTFDYEEKIGYKTKTEQKQQTKLYNYFLENTVDQFEISKWN